MSGMRWLNDHAGQFVGIAMMVAVLWSAVGHAADQPPYPHVDENVAMNPAEYKETFRVERHWVSRHGALDWSDGHWTLTGDPIGEAHFRAYPHNRVGGNIKIDYDFKVHDLADDARIKLAANVFQLQLDEQATGIESRTVEDSLTWERGRTTLRMQHAREHIDWQPEPGKTHRLSFVQIGRHKQVWLDGEKAMVLDVTTPWVCSEGDVLIEVQGAKLTLTNFTITPTEWDEPERSYIKGERLYHEDFTDPAAADNWMFEYRADEWDVPPIIHDGWLRVERASVAWSKARFTGPLIYSFDVLPIPGNDDDPNDITDAIFFFNIDPYKSDTPLPEAPRYTTPLGVYNGLDGYWIDFGGNNNDTTRMRRLPFRHLLRQSIDPADMLKPQHVHEIEIVAADPDVRFIVDGRVVLSYIDRTFKADGHFGVLGFVRPTQIRNFQVHRAVRNTDDTGQ